MPFIFSERLPVPTLKSYVCISLLIFAASAVYWQRGISEQTEPPEEESLKTQIPESKKKYSDLEHGYGNLLDRTISKPFLLWVSTLYFEQTTLF